MATFRLHGSNGSHTGHITATFHDGSKVTVRYRGESRDEYGERQAYRYRLTLPGVPTPLQAGDDLRSESGGRVNLVRALQSWVAFAEADAERHGPTMDGTPFGEWACQNSDELGALSLDLGSWLSLRP